MKLLLIQLAIGIGLALGDYWSTLLSLASGGVEVGNEIQVWTSLGIGFENGLILNTLSEIGLVAAICVPVYLLGKRVNSRLVSLASLGAYVPLIWLVARNLAAAQL